MRRFESSRQIQKLVGLSLWENSSGKKKRVNKRKTRINMEDCGMILKLKKKNSLIILLLCCIMLVSCGQENAPTNKLNSSKEKNNSTRMPDIIENSSLPTQNQKKSKDSNNSKRKKMDAICGKWKISNMVGEGYIYGDFSMEDYVGGTVTIHENYIESNLPLGRWKLNNPIYKFKKQNKDDFWEYSHANMHNKFGFKSEQIESVTVFDNKDRWDEFGWIFWIRDKEHLIFLGPVYFLAERIE